MNIDLIEAAAKQIKGHAVRTPLLNAPLLDETAGRRIFVKSECLQKTGSFKYRGARSAISAMDAGTRAQGVIAFSSGNHAQGVALAASEQGAPAVIVMPRDAPKLKIDNTQAYGAEVVLYDRATEDRDAIGQELAEARGLTLIKPYDEPQVIAGQGTVGLEIAAQAEDQGVDAAEVLVCCGGGGLTSGIALALAAKAPAMQVRPVEPEGFDDVTRSLRVGARQTNNAMSGSICDAILTPSPGKLTFPILQEHCGPGVVVTDEEAQRAMVAAFLRLKVVLEPGGAVALAAALFHGQGDEDVIVVASGGNVDAPVFQAALDRFG
ncbi:MAG: threonine/serine dehydratase [Paracoccaceae bacterium]|nr:threonine/serine dehydratase [Paracoccaceae bacterium]